MRKIQEIKLEDEKFPEKLRKIKNPPVKLYAMGNVDLLQKPSLAIVGTRRITEYGIKNCKYFAEKIVEKDIPIVSGMAMGTDSVAHRTALKCGGETIAVLGSGFEHIFPKENMGLFEQIILERNRIVSGLSEGILIIEAAYRSGTSVTAKLAYSQGKVVMALPGRLDNSYGVGVNKLIQEGAKLVMGIEDVISSFPQFMHKLGKTRMERQMTFWDVKEEYQEIVKILQSQTLSVEEILQKTKEKNVREVLRLLINMELEGLVRQEIGTRV